MRALRLQVALGTTACVVSGCAALPYQPEELDLPPDESAFAMLADAVRVHFPRLVVCDRVERRLQSAWVEVDDGAVPGRRRVTVFSMGPSRVGIVVELSWLRMSITGMPSWTAPIGDARSERDLAEAIRARLAAGAGQ